MAEHKVSFARRRADALRAQPAPQPEGEPHNTLVAIAAYRRPMSAKELAPLLGMSDDRLYALTRAGKVPRMVVPGSGLTKYDPAVIADWLGRHNPQMRKLARAS